MLYRTCGDSGVKLPLISLGLWHNFGAKIPLSNIKKILFYAFDRGITHFDLANNYGPPYGSTEINFGKIISKLIRINKSCHQETQLVMKIEMNI